MVRERVRIVNHDHLVYFIVFADFWAEFAQVKQALLFVVRLRRLHSYYLDVFFKFFQFSCYAYYGS